MPSHPDAIARRLRAQFVRRAVETDAPLLAASLARYAQAENLTWLELAQRLHCTADDLNHIAACRPPRPEQFAADVQRIARTYVNPDLLLPLLREIAVLQNWAEEAEEANPPAFLLAARDVEEEANTEDMRRGMLRVQEEKAAFEPHEPTDSTPNGEEEDA